MGLSESIFKLNHLDITAPDYTTVCRRLKHLPIPTNATNYDPREKLVVLIDSTGLKIMGEGEWTIKKHGKQYDRDWRKIHLAIDHASQDIIASYTTHGDANDVTGLEPLLKQCDKQHIAISEVIGDGAYEGPKAHAKVRKRGGRLISTPKKQSVVHNIHKVRAIPEIPKIPNVPSIPKVTRINGIARERQLANRERQRAVRKKRVEARRKQIAKYKKRQKQDIKKHKEQYDMYHDRNSYITDIKEIGVKRWKQKVNYHRRSQAETAMFRLKSNFGGCLKSKTKANQIAEVKLRINLLNTFTSLGLPKYA
jgi:hypothetical protein